MKRRWFLQMLAALPAAPSPGALLQVPRPAGVRERAYAPGRIANEYSLLLPGERKVLDAVPMIEAIERDAVKVQNHQDLVKPGQDVDGWLLLAVAEMNGSNTAVFEKMVSHQGVIVYMTEAGGVILRIPKGVGGLSNIRPRPINAGHIRFARESPYRPGPDGLAEYILGSNEDPCFENVAALGSEYIGWTLVANEQAGPFRSLFLDTAGRSRELVLDAHGEAEWAPDTAGAVFEPSELLPGKYPGLYRYFPGFSKRTLLGGYLPVANTGVWNPEAKSGYEVLVLLPPGEDAKPMGRVRAAVPEWAAQEFESRGELHRTGTTQFVDRYWNSSAGQFYSELAGVANHWQHFFEDRMKVDIPDMWLLDAARAGIMLARCSYRGLKPTYQVGEGAYTKVPERSHALFPVAHYEFVWAHQLWNLTAEVEPYFQFYLDNYILPNGNFLYNTQDQVEAPLNAGVFLWNSARAYDYTGDLAALQNRLPVLRRMIDFVLGRYQFSERTFSSSDRRYGLIWGSPEADLGDPENDYPNSHPYYFQNATWTWRGLNEQARCLTHAGRKHNLPELENEGKRYADIAAQMRPLIERSLTETIKAGNERMRHAGITPFTPDDTQRNPMHLTSYENHRFMMDWFTADWGDPALDLGHLKHRELAGQQIMGLHTDGNWCRTSNFMAHGTLAVRIRQDDYRPFLLTLYALCCYAADSGNRYSPEDALLPGSYPGEGDKYGWSATINSVLQPSLGLRWLLCYEESDNGVCHVQKAAPKHWFATGQRIHVEQCPTRFGVLNWTTEASSNSEWKITITAPAGFSGQLILHIHPPDGRPLAFATRGAVQRNRVVIDSGAFTPSKTITLTVRT
ncbi:MAG TPA: hypothetical protein VHZ07_06165 [Bryobacteraceae bacterium]|nr:hypothetical protein [Bryobacteraceae bacterium]